MGTPQLSLTAGQRATACGAELLSLCQSVAADGVLTDPEIIWLHEWLAQHVDAPMPAIGFLRETVPRIIADRIVTKEERDELYQAIELVLPPEARRDAKASRRAIEKAELERVPPLLRLNFMVAGVWYEGRENVIRQFVNEGDTVFLVRDPGNQYSRNARDR